MSQQLHAPPSYWFPELDSLERFLLDFAVLERGAAEVEDHSHRQAHDGRHAANMAAAKRLGAGATRRTTRGPT